MKCSCLHSRGQYTQKLVWKNLLPANKSVEYFTELLLLTVSYEERKRVRGRERETDRHRQIYRGGGAWKNWRSLISTQNPASKRASKLYFLIHSPPQTHPSSILTFQWLTDPVLTVSETCSGRKVHATKCTIRQHPFGKLTHYTVVCNKQQTQLNKLLIAIQIQDRYILRPSEAHNTKYSDAFIYTPELRSCVNESRGGRPGLPVPNSPARTVSVDVKQHWTRTINLQLLNWRLSESQHRNE